MQEMTTIALLPRALIDAGYESTTYHRVYNAVLAGRIPAERGKNGRWFFDPSDLERIAKGLERRGKEGSRKRRNINSGSQNLSKADRIILEVAKRNDLTASDILGSDRTRQVAWARQDAMLRLRRETSLSLPQIGRIFQRDHTTVIHGIRRAIEREAQQ